jgi:hypothetical protein
VELNRDTYVATAEGRGGFGRRSAEGSSQLHGEDDQEEPPLVDSVKYTCGVARGPADVAHHDPVRRVRTGRGTVRDVDTRRRSQVAAGASDAVDDGPALHRGRRPRAV